MYDNTVVHFLSFTVLGSHVKLSLQQTKEAKSESEISFASDVIDLLMWHFYCTISKKEPSTETALLQSHSGPKRPKTRQKLDHKTRENCLIILAQASSWRIMGVKGMQLQETEIHM